MENRITQSVVDGTVVQIGVLNGPLTFNGQPLPVFDGTPADAAAQLAQAVGQRWRFEEERRQIQDPFPLPVRWGPAPERLIDRWDNIRRDKAGDDSGPLDLSGRLDDVVDVYRMIESERLVVLGPAGSGKTILTIRFVLDLLETRTSTAAVPVIFSLGSWNPDTAKLRDWMTSQLVRDYPGLFSTGPGKSLLARELVDAKLILPVFDGFDEIADGLRSSALRKLNAVNMPLLLTSRRAEYDAAVTGTDVLTAAAGIELAGLTLTDLVDYLPRTTRKVSLNGTDTTVGSMWDPVLSELDERSQSTASANLMEVLKTPLMVALARRIYSDTPDHDPTVLLNIDRFGTPEALENHLLKNFVPAVYSDQPVDGPAGLHRSWDCERAEEWLGYLAQHLDRLGTRDLAWWQLGSTLRRSVRTLVVGLFTGLAMGAAEMLGSVPYGLATRIENATLIGLVSGVAFGLLYGLMYGGVACEPMRVRIRIRRGTKQPRKTYVQRLMVGFAGGFGFGSVAWLVNALVFGLVKGYAPMPELLYGLLNGVGGGLVSGLTLGLAYSGAAGRTSRVRLRTMDEVKDFRRRLLPRLMVGFAAGFGFGFVFWLVDALVIGLVQGLEIGFTSLLVAGLRTGLTAGLLYGPVTGLVYGLIVALETPIDVRSVVSPSDLLATNRSTVVHQLLLGVGIFGFMGWLVFGLVGMFADWLVFVVVGGLGGALAYGLSLTAWGQWVTLSRIWLPLSGRLPWALNAFIEDAHRLGVLRQSGAVYQFRHARLQDHLANTFRTTR